MKTTIVTLFLFSIVGALVSGFAPAIPASRATSTSSSSLSMGLFDFLQPQPADSGKKKKGKGAMDTNVFAGKGKRITVREDEDNAMWVDDGSGGRKKAK